MSVRVTIGKSKRTGLCSFVTWGNPNVQAAILELFKPSARERLREIAVDESGITAYFDYLSEDIKIPVRVESKTEPRGTKTE